MHKLEFDALLGFAFAFEAEHEAAKQNKNTMEFTWSLLTLVYM